MKYTKKTLNIPTQLLEDAVRLSGATTQTMAVVLGLEELVRKKRLESLIRLGGKGAIELPNDEQKRLRSRK